MSNAYTVKRAATTIALDAGWDSELWQSANELKVDYRFDRGGNYTPDVRIRMLYDDQRICGMFQVKDQYVVSRARHNQEQVCNDSCVENIISRPGNGTLFFRFRFGHRSLFRKTVFPAQTFTFGGLFGSFPGEAGFFVLALAFFGFGFQRRFAGGTFRCHSPGFFAGGKSRAFKFIIGKELFQFRGDIQRKSAAQSDTRAAHTG